jgi:methionyl-tRNA formyltransferase
MENNRKKIIFIGTPEFGAIILKKLVASACKPVLVITAPDRPSGRKQILTPPPVKLAAEKYGIRIIQAEKIKDSESEIKNTNPDLILVAAYNRIIPKEILDIPKKGSFNIHPSLLPRWRGPSPIQLTILNGDKKTGVTIAQITEKVDAGPIAAQKEIALKGKESYPELHNLLGELGGDLLIETIPEILKGEIKPKPQEEKSATYSRIIRKKDGRIDWKKTTAQEIERQIRAFDPWPGTFFFWKEKRIKILKAKIVEEADKAEYPTGKVFVSSKNELCLQTSKGCLTVEKLQVEGKKEISSKDFLRGYPDFIGAILK